MCTNKMLGKGGDPGNVPFIGLDGWTIFLSSENGAKAYNRNLIQVFDVQNHKIYGGEYDMEPSLMARLDEFAEELETYRRRNLPVVVHCNHGRTRSVICIGVYLMHIHNLTAKEALEAIKAAFTAADDPHYGSPGERVDRALQMYEALKNKTTIARQTRSSSSRNICTGNCL